MKKKNKVLLTSMATIAMSTSLLVGGTYALFTSESAVDIAVTSGKVAVSATVKDGAINPGANNMGTAQLTEEGVVAIDRMMPGDEFSFDIEVTNSSNVDAYYRTVVETTEDNGLASALTVSFAKSDSTEIAFMGGYGVDAWKLMNGVEDGEVVETVTVTIKFVSQGDELDNKYNGDFSCKYQVRVEAVQGNAEVEDPYTYENGIYYINNEEGMSLMNGIIGAVSHGEGRSLKFALTDNMDMTGIAWTPIRAWWVDVDGQNHTVSNLTCGIDDWGRSGFIGYAGGAVIKNITFENVTSEGSQAGIVAGSLEGAKLENVKIAGTNSAKFNQLKNPEETWGGVGAIAGVASSVNAENTVEIVSGATVTVNYNGLLTSAPIQNEYAQLQDISAIVTNNGTVTEIGEGKYGFIVANDEELAAAIAWYESEAVTEATDFTIAIADGTYNNTANARANTTLYVKQLANKNLTIKALGENAKFVNASTTPAIMLDGNGRWEGAETLTIEGLTFELANGAFGICFPAKSETINNTYNYAHNVTIKDCAFVGTDCTGFGIQSGSGSNCKNITLEGCEANGIDTLVSVYADTLVVANCNAENVNGFVNNQPTAALTTVSGCTATVNGPDAGYVVRVNGKTLNVTDSNLTLVSKQAFSTGSIVVRKVATNVTISNSDIAQSVANGVSGNAYTICQESANLTTVNSDKAYTLSDQYKKTGNLVLVKEYSATGEETNQYYSIGNAETMIAFRNAIENKQNFNNTTIALDADIDMTGTPWTTISGVHFEWGHKLAGMVFDGKGHTVSNMEITGSGMIDMLSMNGLVTFKNLTMDNVQAIEPAVYNGNQFKGVFVGDACSDLAFDNVTVSNSKISGYWAIGAFVGRAGSESSVDLTFNNCHIENFTIDAPWNYYTSGFVGQVQGYDASDDTITFTGANTVTHFTLNAVDGDAYQLGGAIHTLVSEAENVTVTGYVVNYQ